ncbi:MAG: MBL fold metallo-hydrolase [Chloroflexota bacterium]|nr:MBL fold metallo-hydrolase [Chloroflexota bacterium]
MDITWFGHSCFRITERGRITLITDPFQDVIGIPAPKVKGDVVTVSHDVPGHNNIEAVKGARLFLTGAGEYEISGVYIQGIAMHDAASGRHNIAYAYNYDNITVLHLGDLGDVPDQRMIEAIGQVNVLLLPVGGGNGLKAAQAAEVVALIEPYYVIPMHYALPGLTIELDPVDRFLKAMGIGKVQEADILKVSASDVTDQPQIVVLNPTA